jgi:hypothetical protein
VIISKGYKTGDVSCGLRVWERGGAAKCIERFEIEINGKENKIKTKSFIMATDLHEQVA